ncbi:TPA: tRNA-dihydrouridine synthase [Patescibacteria group bacterium]|nr:tRNA-dihydrouridine synthase [Patescibacteria group bacterium]
MNIFQTIKQEKGFLAMLSPMEDVTDTVFRQILCKIGKPDVFFTEFMNVEGYCSVGKDRVDHRVRFSEIERPIVIQLWGNIPEDFAKTVKELKELNPDGFDINMGCAVRNVLSTGGGSALIKEPDLAKEIIKAVKQEAGCIPVSVKTRLGYSIVDTENWIGLLLSQGLDMLTVHGRIAKDSYAIPSRWDEIQKVVKMRDEISPTTLIIGNGDITSSRQGEEYVKTYGTDGYMVGRGILNNPWIFSGREDIPEEERFNILLEHAKLFNEVWGDTKNFSVIKKYIKAYISDFEGANELRQRLMMVNSYEDLVSLIK